MKKRSSCICSLQLLLTALFLLSVCGKVHGQFYSVSTDALGLGTGTFNVEGSMAVNSHWTIHLPVRYNPWTFPGNKKMKQLSVLPGVRYWLLESYAGGWFFGSNAIVSRYNFGGLLGSRYRYDGMGYGFGLSAGYSISLYKNWNMEFELGGGLVWSRRDKYPCVRCGQKIKEESGVWLAPDKASVSIVYLF